MDNDIIKCIVGMIWFFDEAPVFSLGEENKRYTPLIHTPMCWLSAPRNSGVEMNIKRHIEMYKDMSWDFLYYINMYLYAYA